MSKNQPDLFKQSLTGGPSEKEPAIDAKKGRYVYTVSEITQDVKILLENTFTEIWVEGEVSGISRISTGTVFFSLKDNNSLLKCVMFNSFASAAKFQIKDGMNLLCFGRIGVYEKDGKYQLYVQSLEPKGVGSLQLALEQLKIKLEKEGLFKPEHKRPIPYLPSRIGVVTSSTGAAIKDILKVLERRFKDVHLILNSVRVQGEGAGAEIAGAIKEFDSFNQNLPKQERVEVLIVGRGGGSIEDLWAFNEEVVARAIYNCSIPVISAVGHERDWTISDLVADLRAPTPSVAAEVVIPKKEDLGDKLSGLTEDLGRALSELSIGLREELDDLAYRLQLNIGHSLELNKSRFSAVHKKLGLLNPCLLIEQYKTRTKDLARQIYVRASHFLELRQSCLVKNIEKLSGLSPLNILSRGYSIAFKMPEGDVIKDTSSLRAGDIIKTRLEKGEVISQVKEVK